MALALFASFPLVIQASEEPPQVRDLLTRMSQAVKELNYRGSFTYEYGGLLETLRIVHSVKDGIEYERLEHLSGPEREVVRQGRTVDCLHPGDQLLRGRLTALGEKADIDQYYHFKIRGMERIAGREAIILQVVPKDKYRYGYILGIDKQTGLPLKSLLLGSKKRVLERFQFVEVDLGPMINEKEYHPVSPRYQVADPQLSNCNQKKDASPERWQTTWLPGGFLFSGQRQPSSTIDMLMFTDGLTVFSVFIEPAEGQLMIEGPAQRGATVAFMSQLVSHQVLYRVTVVGEVPILTAQRVASSISRLPSASLSH